MENRFPFMQRHSSGKLWLAGHDVYGLCAAWNHATNPALPMTDREHAMARRYAKAIEVRIQHLNLVYGSDWKEFSNGMRWPMQRRVG